MRIVPLLLMLVAAPALAGDKCPKKPEVVVNTDPFSGRQLKMIDIWLGKLSWDGAANVTINASIVVPGAQTYIIPAGWFQEYRLADGSSLRSVLSGDSLPTLSADDYGVRTSYAMPLQMSLDDLRKLAVSREIGVRSVALTRLADLGLPEIPVDAFLTRDMSGETKTTEAHRVSMACALQKLGI